MKELLKLPVQASVVHTQHWVKHLAEEPGFSCRCSKVSNSLFQNKEVLEHLTDLLLLSQVADPVVTFCETVVETSSLKCFAETPNKK